MSTQEQVAKTMASKSDDDLITLAHTTQLTRSARQAAKTELKLRAEARQMVAS